MKKMLMAFALALPLAIFSYADNALVGQAAPFFKVKSGDNKELSLNDLSGKIIVLFYETKETKEKNRKLKDELDKFYDNQPLAVKTKVARLAVIDCEGVIFAGAWKKALLENSKTEGITVYGDWTGEMGKAYKVKADDSNVIIIDDKGAIRYYNSGQIGNDKIPAIKDLLNTLTKNDK